MAFQIDGNTWPLALALLPEGFQQLPFDQVVGCYVVINSVDLAIERTKKGWKQRAFITPTNCWMTAEDFKLHYAPKIKLPKPATIDVEMIPVNEIGFKDHKDPETKEKLFYKKARVSGMDEAGKIMKEIWDVLDN
jgi:hypothetical protein